MWEANQSDTSSSSISSQRMNFILEKLKSLKNRDSTKSNYLSVWRKFNNFLIKLDVRPLLWEDRASLFGAALVEQGIQSSTLKSYMSAIKRILTDDGYHWDDSKLLLSMLVRGCHVVNDCVKTRLPIQGGLLEMILFEIERKFTNQHYLEIMYKTIICLCYYGLFRIGELTYGPHAVKACDIHMGRNKNKILIFLRSSKTHDTCDKPQEVKITSNARDAIKFKARRHFCPFDLTNTFLSLRGGYNTPEDLLFMFKDKQPVKPSHVRKVLWNCIKSLHLDPLLYNTHSLRSGRAVDMLFKFNTTLEQVKSAGRWRSNTVYRYI